MEVNAGLMILMFIQLESVRPPNTHAAMCARRIEMWTNRDIDRTKRIKEARDEAKKEIQEYKKTKEAEFKKFETEVCVTSPDRL